MSSGERPFGNLYDLPVYGVVPLAENETIVFDAGTRTETMRIPYADYEPLSSPHGRGVLERPGHDVRGPHPHAVG